MGWADGLLSIAFPLLIAIGFAVGSIGNATLGEFLFVRLLFVAAALDIAGLTLYWLWNSDIGSILRFGLAALAGAAILTSLLAGFQWVDRRQNPRTQVAPQVAPATTPTSTKPSFVFVFGAPLGDNNSFRWIMMLKHYGPALAYNCDIIFYDDDRKSVEHEWLVKHPDSPYPPPGLTGESQRHIQVQEAGPEGSVGSFVWDPLDPNSQHYTVSISCRDGYFVEKWEIARVNGILRSTITIEHGAQWIEKNPDKESVVFRYRDPEFVSTALATEMPKAPKGKVVHPGWKPQYTFQVPAAIIDPNGNVQVVSGVKQPDGSTLTDFGSWNILTRHFGE